MRYKLPDGVHSVSVNGKSFVADEKGVIDAPGLTPEEQRELMQTAGGVPLSLEEDAAAQAAVDEAEHLASKLADLGVAYDRRRRYPVDVLRGMVEDAEAAAKARAEAEAAAKAEAAARAEAKAEAAARAEAEAEAAAKGEAEPAAAAKANGKPAGNSKQKNEA